MLRIFERRIIRRIYGEIKENGVWRARCNRELYKSCNEPDVVKVIRVGRLRWLRQLFRMQELTLHKPEGTRRETVGFRNWRRKS
jgi:hypothetical protein